MKVLYVSGEESESQLKLRAKRLSVDGDSLLLLCETSMDNILAAAEQTAPDVLIVDSIQTLYTEDKTSSPGSTMARKVQSLPSTAIMPWGAEEL